MRWRDVRREWMSDPTFAQVVADEFPYRNVVDAVIGLRAAFALTQEEFAAKVGLKQPFIARMESGRYPVDLRTIKRIADALGVEWTVTFAGPKGHPADRDWKRDDVIADTGGPSPPSSPRRRRDTTASRVREAVEQGYREAAAASDGDPKSGGADLSRPRPT
jgi:transcriptional regulator with XRE-family HTH domain